MATIRIPIALECHGKARGFRPSLGESEIQVKIKPCRECGARYAVFFAPVGANLFPVASAVAGLDHSRPVSLSLLVASLQVLAPTTKSEAPTTPEVVLPDVIEEAPVAEAPAPVVEKKKKARKTKSEAPTTPEEKVLAMIEDIAEEAWDAPTLEQLENGQLTA